MTRLLLLLAAVPVGLSAAPVPKAPPGEPVGKRVFRVWREVKVATVGADGFPAEQTGDAIEDRCEYDFTPDGIDLWPATGPRCTAHWFDEVRVDPDATPMRLDGVWHGWTGVAAKVEPAVFKFDGDKLVVHWGRKVERDSPKVDGDYPARPKGFTPARGTQVVTYELSRANVPGTPEHVRWRYFGCWREEKVDRRDAAGKPVEAAPCAMRLGEDEIVYWDWGGELSPRGANAARIDTTTGPMRVDILGPPPKPGEERSLSPGIFKFDGDKLVTAFPYGRAAWVEERADGEYAERPKDFVPGPGVEVAVLVRCRYLQQAGGR